MSELKRAAEKGELVPKDELSDENDDEETAESLYTASDLNAALERGDTDDFAAILAALMEDKVSTGKTEAQAKASVKSAITAYWKKQYLSGYQDTETRKRIIAMANDMGYIANAVARALKTNRSYNLGMLFADDRRSGLGHEYFSTVLEVFKAEAESHG